MKNLGVRNYRKSMSLILQFTDMESRAMSWYEDMTNMGGQAVSSAYMALSTIPNPDPLFVAFISEGQLARVGEAVSPATGEAVHQLAQDGLYFPGEVTA